MLLAGCGGGGGGGGGSSSVNPPSIPVGDNVLLVTVNGSECSDTESYPNKPCVSVRICEVGSDTCIGPIKDILLDTMSSGLRIFKQALGGLALQQITVDSSQSLAECVTYGDGSRHWGPIKRAGIVFGGETLELPIQVVDADFGPRPSGVCTAPEPDPSPAASGFNGILGIGYWTHDCGETCEDSATELYWKCNGSTCTQTTVLLASQVQNPVALLSVAVGGKVNNNGFYVQFPNIPAQGTTSANGYLVLGIGTRDNNIPSNVTRRTVNAVGEFTTVLSGQTYYDSIADTGSNALFFSPPPGANLPVPVDYWPWFCPTSTQSFTATIRGSDSLSSGPVSFELADFRSLYLSGNIVFLVPHHLEFVLFPSDDRFLNKDLTDHAAFESPLSENLEFFNVISHRAPGPAQGEAGPDNNGEAYLTGDAVRLFHVPGKPRPWQVETNVLHGSLELFTILCLLDSFIVGADQLDMVSLEYAPFRQNSGQVETCLTAKGGQQGIRAFGLDDLLEHFRDQGFNIRSVCHIRIGHDSGRVAVDQYNPIAFLTECLARLTA